MEATSLPDEGVVALVRDGRSDAFEILMRRHNQRIYRAVRGVLSDEAEVEDVMQQAYFRAFTSLGQLEDGAKVAPWLVRIAVNEAFDRLRTRRRLGETELELELETAGETSAAHNPEADVGDLEVAALLEAAVSDLREIYRVVFILREVEGLSTAEAALALGVSEQVVKTRLFRARELLRDGLLARAGRSVTDVFTFQAPRCDRVVAAVLARIKNLS
jgi:RNA polymerase sigma-70 factor (ECF subfamily)